MENLRGRRLREGSSQGDCAGLLLLLLLLSLCCYGRPPQRTLLGGWFARKLSLFILILHTC